jgi:hypothetical protein
VPDDDHEHGDRGDLVRLLEPLAAELRVHGTARRGDHDAQPEQERDHDRRDRPMTDVALGTTGHERAEVARDRGRTEAERGETRVSRAHEAPHDAERDRAREGVARQQVEVAQALALRGQEGWRSSPPAPMKSQRQVPHESSFIHFCLLAGSRVARGEAPVAPPAIGRTVGGFTVGPPQRRNLVVLVAEPARLGDAQQGHPIGRGRFRSRGAREVGADRLERLRIDARVDAEVLLESREDGAPRSRIEHAPGYASRAALDVAARRGGVIRARADAAAARMSSASDPQRAVLLIASPSRAGSSAR